MAGNLSPWEMVIESILAVIAFEMADSSSRMTRREKGMDRLAIAIIYLPPSQALLVDFIPPSTFYLPPSTFHLPPSTFHLPPSTFHLPSSTFHLPLPNPLRKRIKTALH
ncbi:uncharacterized protein MYCFIDRAFT_179240 [Pseudocercospora fijiensis CIRAD86]|uniref:Uncharacterized protein n=1 Tax=Pseudocercospora fijiensis (strain CIRAD86) TaxID=383855 RepID=M3AKV0_PSEFD|nr:uncharacterized protein MYCFIDRAFT_179240 [Pseudocercospora fijiensis CIRAD86]EME77748.1 hypothetical protein MYCFIDRAFT_179240 [Pseudocercospora fijiensis CIRAD86]